MDSLLLKLLTDPISLLSGMILRPPRAKYCPRDLGDKRFAIAGYDEEFERQDFQVRGGRGLRLECSHFVPKQAPPARKLPCVVYLHGGARRDLCDSDEFRSSNLEDRGSRLPGPRGRSSPPRPHPAREIVRLDPGGARGPVLSGVP